jgi:RNA polymerase sigma-70 factor (ECF subfamily)
MPEPVRDTTYLLNRRRAGDEGAHRELIAYTCERLRKLSRQMLRKYPSLWSQVQTDDVLNSAVIRLNKALDKTTPQNGQHFFHIAVQHIQWELNELVRRFRGRGRQRPQPAPNWSGMEVEEALSRRPRELTNRSGMEVEEALSRRSGGIPEDPASLAEWGEFHEQAALLPEEEREVFSLLYYGGLTQQGASDVLKMSLRTVRRRWCSAQRRLGGALGGDGPG